MSVLSFQQLFRFLASLKLAVTLLALLAFVLATATIIETNHGRDFAKWYVYESTWFIGLIALLGVNIFSAAAIRFPWKRHQTGFVVTHIGLLILLGGSIRSFSGGVDGHVSLAEGETSHNMVLAGRSQFKAVWLGRPNEPPYEFTFRTGPADWPDGKTLDIGEVDGLRTRVLAFYRHARVVEQWVSDATKLGGPVVKLKVTGTDGVRVAEEWLADQQFGEALLVGPIKLQLERAANDQMLADFLQPPDVGEKGLLCVYFADVVQRISVEDQVGQKIRLENTGASVELVKYLPHAVPDRMGEFTSKGEQPKNPMVELRVHIDGEPKPYRQIAFAKDPLLNLDGVYDQVCPVKFRFYHSAVKLPVALEMLQTSDGKLYGRVASGGQYAVCGELTAADKLVLPGNFELSLLEYIPHARQKISFEPVDRVLSAKEKQKSEPAALVEISSRGTTQQAWLRRNDLIYGRRTLPLPQGLLSVKFEYGRVPLGFGLTLVDFRRDTNPGNVGNASFASKVRIDDKGSSANEEHEISMNEPLTQGKFTFYQSGFDETVPAREVSTLSVAYDPGRSMKYSGSLMICVGIAIMFYMRAYFFKSCWRFSSWRASDCEFGPAVNDEALIERPKRYVA